MVSTDGSQAEHSGTYFEAEAAAEAGDPAFFLRAFSAFRSQPGDGPSLQDLRFPVESSSVGTWFALACS